MKETETEHASSSADPTTASMEDFHTKYLYAIAELDNLRKRAQRDIEQARDQGEAYVASKFLPLIDDFSRALDAIGDADGETLKEQVLSGLALIKGKFIHTLFELEIEGFESQGKQFAAEFMDAVAKVPTNLLPAGTVVGEVEQGFRRRGKLLRAAKVAVAVPEEGGDDEPNAP